MKIGFIGLGNMATAIMGGLLAQKIAEPSDIIGYDKFEAAAKKAVDNYKITTVTDEKSVAETADVLFLAVKPNVLPEVLPKIGPFLNKETIVISIAAGKTLAFLEDGLGFRIVAEEKEALALDSPGQALRRMEGTVLVSSALPFIKIRCRLFALLCTPFEESLLATLEVAGLVGAFKYMVHERRIAPVGRKGHVEECTDNPGLGDDPVLGRALAILEIVGDEIGIINGKI